MSRYIRQSKIDTRWTPQLAYAVGLIASDGWISHDERHVCLKSAEIDLVRQFQKSLAITNKISITKGSRRDHYRTQAGDRNFCLFLNSIGLTRNKSKTIGPITLPDGLFSDFLRGLFDGDGTCYYSWDKRWPLSFIFQVAIASASPVFIRWLKSKLTSLFGVNGFIKKGAGVENLTYNKSDCRKLAEAMYCNHQGIFLERKLIRLGGCMVFDGMLKLTAKINRRAEVAQR